MTGRTSPPAPTEKQRRQTRFWAWVGCAGCVVLPLSLLGIMAADKPALGFSRVAPRDTVTLIQYVTREQCTDAIIAHTTLLYESGMDSTALIAFRKAYPREDSLAQILHSQLNR